MLIASTGPGITLAPNANPTEQLIDLVMLTNDDRAQLAAYLDDRLAGEEPGPLNLTVESARYLRMTPASGTPIRIDDEIRPEHSSPRIEIEPGPATQLLEANRRRA
jgi:diacylglycerol kinase family enzyme